MVIPVPVAPVIERHDEQVAAVKCLEPRPAACHFSDCIAQRPAEPAQERGLEQEVADFGGLTLQDLFGQVVDDVAVVPGEAGDEAGDVVATLHRKSSELERGYPSLGAFFQSSHVLPCELQSHGPVEVGSGLGGGEPQVCRTDLDQFSTGAQPGDRERGIGTAGNHQVKLWRQVIEQERHTFLDLARLDQVVVVEHQHDVVSGRAEVIEERREYEVDRRRLGRGQELKLVRTDRRRHCSQGGDDIRPERSGVVVASIDRQPCD